MNYYNGYGQPYPMYGGYQQQMQQQGQMANMRQQPLSPAPMTPPFIEVKFMTAEEAKAHIIAPNCSAILIDKEKNIAYFKTTDYLGKSTLEEYSFTSLAEKPSSGKPDISLESVVSKDEIKDYGFITKTDLEPISRRLTAIEKQLSKTNGGKNDGNK